MQTPTRCERESLERFLRGELAPAQNRAVVRHLLTGCPECLKVTRPCFESWGGKEAIPAESRP